MRSLRHNLIRRNVVVKNGSGMVLSDLGRSMPVWRLMMEVSARDADRWRQSATNVTHVEMTSRI